MIVSVCLCLLVRVGLRLPSWLVHLRPHIHLGPFSSLSSLPAGGWDPCPMMHWWPSMSGAGGPDIYIAFDSIEHTCIIKTSEYFGFCTEFFKAIHIMYQDINSSVSLSQGTPKGFPINRGIRQGFPSSP